MKFSYLILAVLLLTGYQSYAQNTYPWPSTGPIGIGTSNPLQPLEVSGTGGSFNSTAKVNAIFTQDHTNYRGIYLGFDTAGQIGIIAPATSTTSSNLAFWNYKAGAGWAESMRITSDGNLGIGTTTPSSLLSIGPATTNKKLFIYDTGTEASGFGQGNSEFRIFGISSGTNHISFGKYDLTGDAFSEQMRLDNAGNFSIGATDSKGYKLAVNGNVIATAMTVKLYSQWPDYVFKKDYQLPSLQEVKAYIDQNQHLPEIPSEQEIAKNGLNLGEMNKLLMKKVEELTLYLIEKDKQDKEKDNILISLQNQIDQLKNKSN